MRKELVDWIQLTKVTHSLEQIYNQLIKTGYVKSNMEQELVEVFGAEDVQALFKRLDKLTSLQKPSEYPDVITDNKSYLIIDGRVCHILFELKLPRVVMVENFISDEECRNLINLATPKLDRSTVVDRDNVGKSKKDEIRTSSGMFFSKNENSLISELEERIATFTNWSSERQESFQILNYLPGQEYKAHNDYFDTSTDAGKEIIKRGGQRLGTVILYLNNCPEGGSTLFPESGLEVKPVKGCAVFFGYPTHDSRSKTLHSGMPVIKGEKWIAVKWLRQNEFI